MSGLPDGMANGPSQSNYSGEEAQIWERPWTLEEMRQTSASWSLAADSGLFLFLQDFSQRMLSKTHEIEKQLDGLIRDTKATDCCLHSVFNDFLMLSNTQFIENRVYDEEVEEPAPKAEALVKQPEQEKTREQKEAELIPKMQEAVNYGLRVLDSAFEQLDIKAGNSDSEDEEATDRVEAILEPKDLYVDRPLPYLIGSQAFMEQDDVGLGDLSSDEMSIDSDRDSVVESEDDKEAVQSDEDFDMEEEGQGSIKKKSSMLSYEDDEEEDEGSDIFGESDKEDDDNEDDDRRSLCHNQNTGPSSFADELAARIKGEPVSKPEGDRTSLSSKKKSKGKKEPKPARQSAVEDDSDDLFKPPKMEDDDFSPFGGKGGLFSGGKGLFDDDDEGDLFSDAPKTPAAEEKTKPTTTTTEPAKPGKKIPQGGVAIFPDNSLFGSGNDSDSVESRENGSPVKPKTQTVPRQAPVGGGGGLFDDEEEEDDFFSGRSLKKSSSAGQEKPKPKRKVDLFGGDDEDDNEDGDIFSESSSAVPPAQSKKEAVEEQAKAPEKKMPAGAISMFGPGTKSLLTEGLRKRQPSTSEESEKSEENGPPPEAAKAPAKQTPKPHTRGLFSDDEDSQIFPTIHKSQSKPEPTSQGKVGKAPLSIFDDEEEEDLFASAAKSKPKPNQAKASTPQPKKTVTSSLFSDDEDQWLSSKPSAGKPEAKTGGMKPSVSAPSSLPSAKMPQKGSLFDDGDDLFAATKESSQKKSQRVALLFEDEADEDKGSLFSIKPAASTSATAPAAKGFAVASTAPSLFDSDPPEEIAAPKATVEVKPAVKSPETQLPSSPPEGSETKKKPVGAVSLFRGINVLPNKQTKSPLDDAADSDDDFLSKDSPPHPVAKEEEKKGEEKVKTNILSLFDDDDQEDSDWTAPISIPSKAAAKKAPKPAEERSRTKSTGVFQDEELLFSQTQQKDNDPDVDIFASSGKAGSAKPAAPTLFTDEDEDDLFNVVKPKASPPKVAEKPSKPKDEAPPNPASSVPVPEIEKPASSPVKSKDLSTRIGKLQANLAINPTALLPGAVPRIPGAVGVLPGLAPGPSSGISISSPSLSPVTTPIWAQTANEDGVSFESPVQVTTLQSANKGRAKGSVRRRPQSRAARHHSAQSSVEEGEDGPALSPYLPSPALPTPGQPSQNPASEILPNSTSNSALPSSSPSQPPVTEVSPRPSVLTLPVSTNPVKKDSSKGGSKPQVLPSPDEDDLFGSDSLFGSTSVSKHTASTSTPTTKTAQDKASGSATSKKEKERGTASSLFDNHEDDLFQKVKPKSANKKAKASSFMEEDDDEEDIFGINNSSTPTSTASKDAKTSSSFSKQDIFQDEVATVPKAHKKHKEKSLDVSLFDDNVDIFADLTTTSKPKEKSKKKVESKSIFDDDMDDIFSSSSVKAVTKAPYKSKKTLPSQDTSASEDSGNIFDDPLNALGGN